MQRPRKGEMVSEKDMQRTPTQWADSILFSGEQESSKVFERRLRRQICGVFATQKAPHGNLVSQDSHDGDAGLRTKLRGFLS
jgi:hypothetical protein